MVPSVDSRGSGGASYAMGALAYPQASSSASEEGASSGGDLLGILYGETDAQMCTPADALCAPGDVDEDADSRQPLPVQKPDPDMPSSVVDASGSDDQSSDPSASRDTDIGIMQK